MSDEDLLKKLTENKPSYADFLSDVIIKNSNGRDGREMIPEAFIKTFERIKKIG